ncbi:hypothetical protein M427DRAFT_157586 [Gonapodya prolifera JEL478]|uniref:PB1 domain-containing protein n=1 Tax=Gonapodya prolifera (strain JEL478) TaxID=1344416 RepID=A0A139A5H7_GONPJ|nr:hypothetical protein M427DRAFT_157586 [Gonapodya prolifera JEL478]|eukprot:KXS11991.1 hypothetical protein M427DRAFT_157586 [Gonapodya prolifera JEL478]
MSTSFKVFNPASGVTRKITVQSETSWEDIENQIRSLFSFATSEVFNVTYTDQDGDVVTISTTQELRDLVAEAGKPVKFVLATAEGTKDSTQSAAPVDVDRESALEDEATPTESADKPIEEEWILEQVPPSESTNGVATEEPAPLEATAVNGGDKNETTTLEDISAAEDSVYPSANGAADQQSLLEPAETAPSLAQVAAEGVSPTKQAEAKAAETVAASRDAEAGKEVNVETKPEAGQGAQDETKEEFDEDRELRTLFEEFFTGDLASALNRLGRITAHLEATEPPQHYYIRRRVPLYHPRRIPFGLGPFGLVTPGVFWATPVVAGPGYCGRAGCHRF